MKQIFALVIASLYLAIFSCSSTAAPVRERKLIDSDWRFVLGDVRGAETVSFKDDDWQRIGLPHSFGIPYFGSPQFYVGYGWYRKHLFLQPLHHDQRVAIEFEAAFQDAEVFINGNRVGRHQGGYTGFSFDISKYLHAGDNVVAVRLNNRWNPELNPRAGEHNFNGGIYRNVYLVTTHDLHVDWYGTFVTTPHLSNAGGPAHLDTDIRNDSSQSRKFVLITDIFDASDRRVATVSSKESIPANATITFDQSTPFIPKPSLWSPAHPNMYVARTKVLEGTRLLDEYFTPFGFRWIRWTADKGFFLNGQHYYFHGADVHQDHAGWGDAVTNSGIARDVRLVKEAGMDFIRGSHYPHSPEFSDACDRMGLLLWEENSFWGTGGVRTEGTWTASAYPPNERDQKPFEESVERSLREMIRVHRNHPSIIAWSMTNEVFFSDADLMPKVRTFLAELVRETHELDPTRPAAAGGVQRGDLDHIADVAGYNGDGAKLFLNPGIPNVVTEYGTMESVRPGPFTPGWGDLEGQPQFTWRSGQALWCAFDHGSIFPSLGRTGMIDYFRLPKRRWYWYRNAYAGIPPPPPARPGTPFALALSTDSRAGIQADGTGDVQVIVSVVDASDQRISNSPPVRLQIVSGPGEFPTGRAIDFAPDSDITIRDGLAAIELRSYQSGRIHLRATSSGLKSADLFVEAKGGPIFKTGITPLAEDRPYKPQLDSLRRTVPQADISLNRPTDSRSNAGYHTSRMANDGDDKTYWQPSEAANGMVWWQVDFEERCQIRAVHLSFGSPAPYRFLVEYQDQAGNWRKAVDKSKNTATASEFTELLPGGIATRLLRIVFDPRTESNPILLREVQVIGAPEQ